MDMKESIISARNITKCFSAASGEFWALKGIDIDIPTGALTILKGRSGSGKTTLINILSTLDKPTDGNILFLNEDITKLNDRESTFLRRKKIGFVFQSVALIPVMSAYENVEYALRLSGFKGNMKERATDCLRMVGLYGRMSHFPNEMSGGEQQRCAIARAIAHRPDVIFADEPTGELDTDTGLQIVKIFKELIKNEGISIIMTTHDPGIMELGDKVYEIEDGEIISG